MKRIITMVIICVVGMFPLNGRVSASENLDDLNIAREKMAQLREVYKEVESAEDGFLQAVALAEKNEPLLKPTKEALKSIRHFYNFEIKDGERFAQYLKNNPDREQAYRWYSSLKVICRQKKMVAAMNDPNLEPLLMKPMLSIWRETQKYKPEELKSLTFDPNDPNDQRLWSNIKRKIANGFTEEELQRLQNNYKTKMNIPDWIFEYAANMGYVDAMNSTYEGGIRLMTPDTLREAQKKVLAAYEKIGHIYPEWVKIRHLLISNPNEREKAYEKGKKMLQELGLSFP